MKMDNPIKRPEESTVDKGWECVNEVRTGTLF